MKGNLEKMIKTLYVAYGSNLNMVQMANRCPDARPLGTSELVGYELKFRGNRSGWGVANIEKRKNSIVPVGVWSISRNDEINLDLYEGYPHLYVKNYLPVQLSGETVKALVYVMRTGHEIAFPSEAYYNTILEGYKDFGIDPTALQEAANKCSYLAK